MSAARSWRKWLVRGAKALLALELTYLLVANLLLASAGFHRALDPVRPGTRIRYQSAWTLVPGVVAVRGFDYLRDGPRRQWSLHADRVWAVFNPALLPLRTVHFGWVAGSGVEVRVRKRPVEPRNLEREALLPPIEGLTLEPRAGLPPRRRAWRVRFDHLVADEVREVWLDTLRWQGRGRAAGGFTSRPRESMTVFRSRIELVDGELTAGTRVLASRVRGSLAGRSRELALPRASAGLGWLEPFSIAGVLHAEGVDGASLDPFLPPGSPLHLSGGAGPIEATVALVDGTLEPGSRLDWHPDRLGVSLLGYEATGSGRLHAAVESGAGSAEAAARVELDHFEVIRAGARQAHLEGEGLSAFVATSDRHVDGQLEGGLRARVALDQARVPDLRVYDAYFPERLGIRVSGGSGELSALFDLAADGRGTGRVELTTQDAALVWERLTMRGRLRLDARLTSADSSGHELDLTGTTLRFEDVSLTPFGATNTVTDWWATLDLPSGTVRPGAPDYLDLTAHARLRDAAPFEALFGQRHKYLARLAGRIDSTGVSANATLRLSKETMTFEDVRVVYPEGTLDARFTLTPGHRQGKLLARWGRRAVGLGFRDGKRDWVLRRAEQWWAR